MDAEPAPSPRDSAPPPPPEPSPQRTTGPPASRQPRRGLGWRAVWVMWLWAGLWASWAVASGDAHVLLLLVLTFVLGRRWLADAVRTFIPRVSAADVDRERMRGLRHPLVAPATFAAMFVVIASHALLVLRIKVSEPWLLQLAAEAGEGDDTPGPDPQFAGGFFINVARTLRDGDGNLVGTELGTGDQVFMADFELFLAADDAPIRSAKNISTDSFHHVFGRWWVYRLGF